MRRLILAAAICLPGALACSRGSEGDAARALAGSNPPAPAPAFDAEHPERAFALDADAVARGLGSFEWSAAVEWSVARGGADAARVHVTEHHTLRQLADGSFEVKAELDPGRGPGSATGRQIAFVGGTTYARALPAPFRVRPTDRGRDARRVRDESFQLAGAVAALVGPALKLDPQGGATFAGRAAHRYRLSLAQAQPAAASEAALPPGARTDPDTARRRAFLTGRVPVALEGELLADAATGAPLRVRLTAAFTTREDPGVRTTTELLAQVKAVGASVKAVSPPEGALPDERKPAGPSTALEAAGLKKRGEKPAAPAEPRDEGE